MKLFGKKTLVAVALTFTVAICLAQNGGPHGGQDDELHDGPHGRYHEEFVHGITIDVDGEHYYLAGAPDGPDGAFDIPGHSWVSRGANVLIGKHYNTGPSGASNWWSSDAEDGELLFTVKAVIDGWSEVKSIYYIARGYVHYHELVRVSDGKLHPSKVVWLRHTAQASFTLDGGPHPELSYTVAPGLDLDFIPNALHPYEPGL